MLKLLAAVFMLLDHVGYYLHPMMSESLYILLRSVGRLAFPIFAYSVARGYERSRNPSRYFLRLLLAAALSEGVIRAGYAIAGMTMHWTNVLFTFALSIAVITGYRLICHCGRDLIASMRPVPAGPAGLKPPARFDVRVNIFGIELDAGVGAVIGVILIFAAMVTAVWIKCDYDIYGILTVLSFYIAYDQPDEKSHARRAILLLTALNTLFFIQRLVDGTPFGWAFLQNLSLLALPLILQIRDLKKPSPAMKYFFYVFYPLHIFLLLVLRSVLI